MKKLVTIFFLFLMIAGQANASFASIENKPLKESTRPLTDEQKVRLETLKNTIAEIQSLDKSKLSKAEQAELRRELKQMKKEAKKMSNKSFIIALGGIVIIIMILLLAF
jgi:molecular chaperone GrpE (heat shock protein)